MGRWIGSIISQPVLFYSINKRKVLLNINTLVKHIISSISPGSRSNNIRGILISQLNSTLTKQKLNLLTAIK